MNEELVETLISDIRNNKRYQTIDENLIRTLIALEISKGRKKKDIVKHVRAKLHQVGGAYQEFSIPYEEWQQTLLTLPTDLSTPEVKDFCQTILPMHRSTHERLPILNNFYSQLLSEIGPIHSVLDLACGLNPLTLPWMNLPGDIEYFACDIYTDMIGFLNSFFTHTNLAANAFLCDLTSTIPKNEVDVVFAFKTVPCLEQVDKTIGQRIFSEINSPNIFASFPVQSLGGHEKGMRENYRQHFYDLVAGKPWKITEHLFSTELVFFIQK